MTRTTEKPQGSFLARLVRKQIFIPLAALLILIVFNFIADPSFFAITLKENSLGDLVLTGNLITILDNASELVILAIGMTLVTAASGGQDISVGSAIAIAGSVVLRVLCGTMLTGGVGNIIGTLFGVLSLSTIKNIVSSLGLDEAWWTNITVAAMICLFLVIQSLVLSRKNKDE